MDFMGENKPRKFFSQLIMAEKSKKKKILSLIIQQQLAL
jgi:hypothetical protein